MKRMSSLLVLPLLLSVWLFPRPVEALWCSSDPVFSFGGIVTDITINIPLEHIQYVNGPIHYTIDLPATVQRSVIVSDLGYNLHGITISYTNSTGGIEGNRFLATVKVSIPIDATRLPAGTTIPTQLTILPLNGSLIQTSGTSSLTEQSVWINGL